VSDFRLYAFVDESGQDSGGLEFLVSVLLLRIRHASELDGLRAHLQELEKSSGRRFRKWSSSGERYKIRYLEALLPLLEALAPIYWRAFGAGTHYDNWTATAVADAWLCCGWNESVTVTVDGLQERPARDIRRILRAREVRFRDVRGRRDEAEPLLRLSDAVVGFLRDHRKGAPYTGPLWPRLQPYLRRLSPRLLRRALRNRQKDQQGPACTDPCNTPGCP
jgi:hypothetical protein